jgi:hypothetical protein
VVRPTRRAYAAPLAKERRENDDLRYPKQESEQRLQRKRKRFGFFC